MRSLPVGVLLAVISAVIAVAQEPFLPGTDYDPRVPTPKAVLGYDLGERLSNHTETDLYIRSLAAASEKVHLVRYGESWEGRSLSYLVIGRSDRLRRLPEIQKGLAQIADPRGLTAADEKRLLDELPAVSWLAFSVHGNEVSCTDAALQLAYHLAAAKDDEVVDAILGNSLVVVDPLQNPDGRERFVSHFYQSLGRWPDSDPAAAEHDEPWPGGRSNHYLFDMNRDWFAATQPETQARVHEFQKWWPQVFVDVHTMGSNSTYYFGPPALPHHPEITPGQHRWLTRYGQNNARWFDRMGFDYFTREQFDAFYPGYGEGWPTFQGAVGMTFEAASVRGLLVRRDDESVLAYRNTVQQHFVATLGTAETTARNRRDALESFLEYRRSAVARGTTGLRAFVLLPGDDPGRLQALGANLAHQGVEVQAVRGNAECVAVKPHGGGLPEQRALPDGALVVPLDQPAGRLVRTLLAKQFDMDADFLEKQRERYARRKGAQFYDLTGWSLPLLWGIDCVEAHAGVTGDLVTFERRSPAGALPRAKVAYLLPWGQLASVACLAELQREGLRIHALGKEMVWGGRRFAPGTLVVKVAQNGDAGALHATLSVAAEAHGVQFVPVNSSWVDDGIALGSGDTRYLPAPKVAMLWDRPASGLSAGHARWVLERQLGQKVTVVRSRSLGRLDLARFNVLVVPDGRYGSELQSQVPRLKDWVRKGGTLVGIGGATRFFASEGVGLLTVKSEERKDGEPKKEKGKEKGADGDEPFDYEKAILPGRELPTRTTGALLRILLEDEHWLAFGYGDGECTAVSTTSAIYSPLTLDRGTNVGRYADRDALLRSGFVFEDKLDQLAGKAWLLHQGSGRGHVVGFTEDPNFRGFAVGLRMLFANAVFLGPGF